MSLRYLEPIDAESESGLTKYAIHAASTPQIFLDLFKAHALHDDLRALCGISWLKGLDVLPSTGHQVTGLREIQRNCQELLAAHSYVRYLSDLGEDQQLKHVVTKIVDF